MTEQARTNFYLIGGGVISALIAILHVILALEPSRYQSIRAGQESVLGQMAEQGSPATVMATFALAAVFAVWAIYAFSGIGLLGLLPAFRTGLIVIGVIYILRALVLIREIKMVMDQGYPPQSVVFSTTSLAAGLLYLIGILKRGSYEH